MHEISCLAKISYQPKYHTLSIAASGTPLTSCLARKFDKHFFLLNSFMKLGPGLWQYYERCPVPLIIRSTRVYFLQWLTQGTMSLTWGAIAELQGVKSNIPEISSSSSYSLKDNPERLSLPPKVQNITKPPANHKQKENIGWLTNLKEVVVSIARFRGKACPIFLADVKTEWNGNKRPLPKSVHNKKAPGYGIYEFWKPIFLFLQCQKNALNTPIEEV